VYFLMHAQIHSPTFVDECCHLHVEVGNFSDSPRRKGVKGAKFWENGIMKLP